MIGETARAGWWHDAACRGRTNLFFATDRLSQQIAVSVCRGCPVRGDCTTEVRELEDDFHRFGVRAGLTPGERRRSGSAGVDAFGHA